ncbi:helix-turn-helix domain-containing protein [Streptomyces sp. NBC_00178]|nr:Tn3 family transposase [Streptomyces sp. NBC_00178]
MGTKDGIREFLIAKRASITPEQAGLAAGDSERRVPGPRREEAAVLAGMSPDYYTKLERGSTKLRTASDGVLDSIARVLQLTDVEREHLNTPARGTAAPRLATPVQKGLRESMHRVLDSLAVPPAYNTHQDVIATNLPGRAMFAQLFDSDSLARFTFLDSRAEQFFAHWPLACSLTAAMLRFQVGRDPPTPASQRSSASCRPVARSFDRTGPLRTSTSTAPAKKAYCHPEAGTLDVSYGVLEMPGEPGTSITTYTAEDGSPTTEKFPILTRWAAARNPASGHGGYHQAGTPAIMGPGPGSRTAQTGTPPPHSPPLRNEARPKDPNVTIAAQLVAHGYNIGYTPLMGDTDPLKYGRLSHVDQTYPRLATYRAANATLTEHQAPIPPAKTRGGD